MKRNRKHRECFTNGWCCTDRCPNAQYDMIDDRWGIGIADDCGLERIKCKDCIYESGDCRDCLWQDTDKCTGERDKT